MKIWAHTLVKNEERYIWFSIMSVIEHVDKVLAWDTGSTDKTVAIIKEVKSLYPKKIDFREVGGVDINKFTEVRQKMLDETNSDWVMILDGDEVWWEQAIIEVTELIRKQGNSLESIVSRYYNIVGDIYHYQEEKAGMYSIDGEKGHLNTRFINRSIPGLHFAKPHGQQGLFDNKNILIQNRTKKFRKHMEIAYLHFTNVVRSSSRNKDLLVPKRDLKLKYDLGINFPLDFYYPEVFFKKRPEFVATPWVLTTGGFRTKSFLLRPLRFMRYSLLPVRSGY